MPLALKQQHSFALVSNMSTLEAEVAEMHDKRTCQRAAWAALLTALLTGGHAPAVVVTAPVDYLMGAGFDFMGTESGFSEFQKGNCSRYDACPAALAAHVASNSACSLVAPLRHAPGLAF